MKHSSLAIDCCPAKWHWTGLKTRWQSTAGAMMIYALGARHEVWRLPLDLMEVTRARRRVKTRTSSTDAFPIRGPGNTTARPAAEECARLRSCWQRQHGHQWQNRRRKSEKTPDGRQRSERQQAVRVSVFLAMLRAAGRRTLSNMEERLYGCYSAQVRPMKHHGGIELSTKSRRNGVGWRRADARMRANGW